MIRESLTDDQPQEMLFFGKYMTYCLIICENIGCKRHRNNAPGHCTVDMTAFRDCDQYIKPK